MVRREFFRPTILGWQLDRSFPMVMRSSQKEGVARKPSSP